MSPEVHFDKDALDKVAAAIYEAIDAPVFIEKIKALKKDFDWNPFDEDGDEFETAWDEIRHNFQLIGDVAMAAVHCAERVTIAGVELTAPQKHAAVVQALDDIIRLPWYAEPFDGPALNMAVSTAVSALNSLNWFKELSDGVNGTKLVDAKTEKIDMTAKVATINVDNVRAARQKVADTFNEVGGE